MKKRIQTNGIIIIVAVLAVFFFHKIFLRRSGGTFLDWFTIALGTMFVLLGQFIRVSSRGFKSEHSKGGGVLIQDGPYALVRNPMYLGIFFIGSGVVLALFSWWVICIFLLFFIIRYLLLIFKEEQKLNTVFPKEYSLYQKRTPRIFPHWRVLLKGNISQYLPLKLRWIKKEILPILIVLVAVILLRLWLDIKG